MPGAQKAMFIPCARRNNCTTKIIKQQSSRTLIIFCLNRNFKYTTDDSTLLSRNTKNTKYIKANSWVWKLLNYYFFLNNIYDFTPVKIIHDQYCVCPKLTLMATENINTVSCQLNRIFHLVTCCNASLWLHVKIILYTLFN